MTKRITALRKQIIEFLSHKAWGGIGGCATIGTLVLAGCTGVVWLIAPWLFSRVWGLVVWLLQPSTLPRYAIIGGLILLGVFAVSAIQRYLSSRSKLSLRQKPDTVVKNLSIYEPIPLSPGVGNSYLDAHYIDPPIGDVDLGGVRFQFASKSLVFDTNETMRYVLPLRAGNRGEQVDLPLSKPTNNIKAVHLLINSGNSKSLYEGEVVGEIGLVFASAPPIIVELELGANIREWCPGNLGDYVRRTTSPSTINVWNGFGPNGANAVIDCLTIPVYECMRNCFLEKIFFVRRLIQKQPDTMGVQFSVFAISLELERSA